MSVRGACARWAGESTSPARRASVLSYSLVQLHTFVVLQPQLPPHSHVGEQEQFVSQVQAVSLMLVVMVRSSCWKKWWRVDTVNMSSPSNHVLNERADLFAPRLRRAAHSQARAGPIRSPICSADGGKPNIRCDVRVRCAASAKPAECAAVESESPRITISHARRKRRHRM